MSEPFRTCEFCGAHLDPGERCDCGEAGNDWADELPMEQMPELDDMNHIDGWDGEGI